jgi:hypothetical protein
LLTRLLRGASVHLIVLFHQRAQHLHHVALRRRLDLALAHNQRQLRTLAQQPMTEQQRRNRSGMEPPGLAPTLVRIGRSIRANMPTLASMAPSIEPEEDAPYVGRRGSAPQHSLLRDRRRQGHVAWRDPPRLP